MGYQATTSAELKLLRLRRTLLSPGRVDFDAGTTTAAVLFATQASELRVPLRLKPFTVATSLSDDTWCGFFEGINVGNREGGVGDGGARVVRGCVCWEAAAATAFAAEVVRVVANLGILLGPWREDLAGEEGGGAIPVLRMFAAPAVDLVTRAGRCSEEVTPRGPGGFPFRAVGMNFRSGSMSSESSSSES